MHRVSWLLAIAILICITALVAQAQDGRNSVLLQPATPNSPALQEVLPPPPPSQPPIVIPTDNPDDLDRESDWRFHEIERRIKKAEERMERDLAESAKLRRDAFEKNDEKLFRRAERIERDALENYTRVVREFERTDGRNLTNSSSRSSTSSRSSNASRSSSSSRNNSRRDDDDDDDRKKDDEKKKKRRFRLWPFGR